MALLFMDGFEHMVTADLSEKYDLNTSGAISTAQARTGTASLSGSGNVIKNLPSASGATFICGAGIRPSTGGGVLTCLLGGSGNQQVTTQISGDGSIVVRRGSTIGTVIAQSAAGAIRFAVWNYIEIKVVIHDSAGTVDVKVNGASVIAATGLDTQYQATATWNGVQIGGDGYYDDFYVCDGSGAQNNDFVGECRVVTLLPSTGNGSNTDFTCSSSTDHGALVDEAAPNDDTDYVYSSTVNHVDSWNYPALGYTGTIKGVQMSLSAKKTDSGTRAIAAVTRPASTNRVHGTNHYLGTSYAYWMSIWELNPEDSAAWEVADVDGAEFGAKVTV